MSTTRNQTQYVPSNGIFNTALNTAYQVAQTIGEKTQLVAEKVGLYHPAEPKHEEFNRYFDPLASPKDLVLIKSQLKHVQTLDKSKPIIDKDIHILKNHHKALFAEIRQQHELKHVKKTRDASAPFIDENMKIKESPQKRLFADLLQPHELRHVAVNDRSAPMIPRDIHITIGAPRTGGLWTAGREKVSSAISTAKQVAHTMGETLGLYSATEKKEEFVNPYVIPRELDSVKARLRHVQTSESKPFLDKDVHILRNNHAALFAEIRQPHELKHVEKTRDSSSPVIDKDVSIKKNQHRELFADLRQRHPLSHVSIAHDASRPFIEKDIHIRESAQKKVLDAGAATLNYALNTAKQAAHTLGEKTQFAAHTVGEKTQQVAHSVGEKTQQAAHSLEEKVGYKFTPSEQRSGEFVTFVDTVASPRDLEDAKSHLKHTQTIDKSKPVIEQNVHIKENHHRDLLEEIEQHHELHHVLTTHDASYPVIDRDIHIKEAPQKQVLSEITQ